MVCLVDGMEDLLQRALGPSIAIVRDLPDGLPPVYADANQLELALLNLAVNARDAMPDGGRLTISASQEHVGDAAAIRGLATGTYVRLGVSDTGTGMDDATLAKAAEPFFTTKGPGKGTGLGLSMVHGLAAQSGGMLDITSRMGRGTRVDLWLPRAEAAAAARPETGQAEAETAVTCSPRAVLVVDDDALVCAGTAAMLEDLGHMVLEAHSGADALLLLDSGRRIDLVVTDQAMPGMTGTELARRIREHFPGVGIILATGYAESPTDIQGLPRLSKPFRQDELAAAIATLPPPRDRQSGPARPRSAVGRG